MPQDAVQLSCEQCKRRKTRCDKISPCSACRAGGLTCVSVQRARLPRGKTGQSKGKHAALEDKVARLESLVGRLETQLHADGNGADGIFTSGSGPTAIVDPVQCASRIESFVARDFWIALSNEVSGLRETFEGRDEEGATELTRPSTSDLRSTPHLTSYDFVFNQIHSTDRADAVLHPSPALRSTLLQVYQDRVDCLFKVLHWPTAYSELNKLWDNAYNDRDAAAAATRVLEHSIYFLAICSLSRDDCERLQLGDRKSLLLSFQTTTETLLAKAALLTTTNVTVLQAFVLYLAGVRCIGGAASAWTLLALAVRIAEACGLPDSPNATSAFDKEMGRRVWFSIGLLDLQTSFGRGSEPLLTSEDFKCPPANINDSEMTLRFIVTESTTSFTDMSFPCLTHHAMMCQRRLSDPSLRSWRDRLDTVAAFELSVNRHFGQFEFSNEPLQKYTAFGARDTTASMHLLLRRPPYKSNGIVPLNDDFDVLDGACRVVQSGLFRQSCTEFAQFSWFWWPKWYALAVLLVELCSLHQGPKFDRAYTVAQESFANYAQSASDVNSGLLWQPIIKLMRHVQRQKEMSVAVQNCERDHSVLYPAPVPHHADGPAGGPVSINVNITGMKPPAFVDDSPVLTSTGFGVDNEMPWYEWDCFVNELPLWGSS